MAYRDFLLAPTDHPAEPWSSPIESARFGLRLGRLYVSPESGFPVADLIDVIDASEFDVIVLRYPADRVDWFAALRRSRYQPIFTESIHLMRLTLPSRTGGVAAEAGVRFQVVEEAGDPSLSMAIERSFKAHQPHFAADPYLPPVSTAEVYTDWMASLIQTPGARVAVTWVAGDPDPAGFYAVQAYDPGAPGEFHIIGSRPDLRRQDLAILSADEGNSWLASQGCGESIAVVQTSNIPIVNMALRLSYRPFLTANTVHLVRPGLGR